MAIQNNTLPSQSNDEKAADTQALKAWAKNHKGLLEVLLDAYCIVSPSNQVVDFNVAFTELCGESYRKILKIGNFCELLNTELCPHQCPAKQIATSGRALRLDELSGASKAYPQLQMILAGVPVVAEDGNILGSLITIRNVSAESELQKKYDERKVESVTDGLTRLFNKAFMEDMLIRTAKTSMREIRGFSVAMCDIDHFKKVNDTYGHQAGDYVLVTVAQMLAGETRESDLVGRFGGEEFIVILSNSDVAGALIFAERFRNRVANTQIFFEGKKIPVTVSLGTATFLEKWSPDINAERCVKELINKADTALYYSKANGRNQVRQFEKIESKQDPTDKTMPSEKATPSEKK
ncbi:MAG: sensor domain-containing diguanylate cyclase [Deltaproteobacteria bacterium]|nr:sensor domain-containing diguanylate cyclase [Deltaproteobacteria bacterium]